MAATSDIMFGDTVCIWNIQWHVPVGPAVTVGGYRTDPRIYMKSTPHT